MYKIIQKKYYLVALSTTFVVLSIVSIFIWGLKFGVDFTGGSLMEVKFIGQKPTVNELQDGLKDLNLGSLTIQPVGETNMLLKFQDTSEEKHQATLKKINEIIGNSEATKDKKSDKSKISSAESAQSIRSVEELRYDSVGPSVGQELRKKAFSALFFVLLGIILYISWSFRGVSKPVASWKYGSAAIIALLHDVIFTIGVFAFVAHYFNMEVNSPFVAAILTVLGYSVNDTIVVFDRIRENLPKSNTDYENTVNYSLNQTLVRSIYTSLTVMLTLTAILVFGGGTIKDFVFTLLIGVFVGTYSSIFLASPIVVIWEKFQKK
jgi:preprotein translocase subunit SecF